MQLLSIKILFLFTKLMAASPPSAPPAPRESIPPRLPQSLPRYEADLRGLEVTMPFRLPSLIRVIRPVGLARAKRASSSESSQVAAACGRGAETNKRAKVHFMENELDLYMYQVKTYNVL